jgi:hypothetical protein
MFRSVRNTTLFALGARFVVTTDRGAAWTRLNAGCGEPALDRADDRSAVARERRDCRSSADVEHLFHQDVGSAANGYGSKQLGEPITTGMADLETPNPKCYVRAYTV